MVTTTGMLSHPALLCAIMSLDIDRVMFSVNVEAAFISYLRGETEWREGHEWKGLSL
jgi:hypothetical protein